MSSEDYALERAMFMIRKDLMALGVSRYTLRDVVGGNRDLVKLHISLVRASRSAGLPEPPPPRCSWWNLKETWKWVAKVHELYHVMVPGNTSEAGRRRQRTG